MGGFMKLQRLGGYAAIASMCVYTVIIVIWSLGLSRYPEINEPIKAMTVIPAIQGGLYTFCLLYVVCGLLSLILALALHERMQSKAPYLTRLLLIAVATSIVMQMASSVIWIRQGVEIAQAQDISALRALMAITDSLHSTAAHLLAWFYLLSGCAIIRTRALSRVLGWWLFVAGILWLPSFAVSQLDGTVLLICVGIVWTGIALLRGKQPQPVSGEMTAASQT